MNVTCVLAVVAAILGSLMATSAQNQNPRSPSEPQSTTAVSSAGDKSPTTAFLLSLLIPGAGWGQYYNGEGGKGTIMLLAFAAGGVVAAIETDGDSNIPDAPIGISLLLAAKLWSVIDAPLSSRRINSRRGSQSAGTVSLDPVLCTLRGSPRPALVLTVGF